MQLAYTYRVDGRDFTGRRIGFGEAVESTNRGWMEKTSSRYAVGRPVSVYFNPRHPEESVLVRRPTYSTWLLLGADAVALAAAAGIASLIFVRFN